jgi:hypothetical protein
VADNVVERRNIAIIGIVVAAFIGGGAFVYARYFGPQADPATYLTG